jgi:hypothetical protein
MTRSSTTARERLASFIEAEALYHRLTYYEAAKRICAIPELELTIRMGRCGIIEERCAPRRSGSTCFRA